ncbi:hypothetical protein JR316_0000118 [Psilocybe cubensis]|uniref:Secreted protein n=2 Tax=Psilocybe cubensis TaxID=181762 RepID=A0A8H7Y8Y2_PSICU|nr:hypothetical protein JR316_0000118 [Psilocybe cubensis]KAH9486054.1 hypothetical protein JR316_0000118 [Psilocybe cubensis]
MFSSVSFLLLTRIFALSCPIFEACVRRYTFAGASKERWSCDQSTACPRQLSLTRTRRILECIKNSTDTYVTTGRAIIVLISQEA